MLYAVCVCQVFFFFLQIHLCVRKSVYLLVWFFLLFVSLSPFQTSLSHKRLCRYAVCKSKYFDISLCVVVNIECSFGIRLLYLCIELIRLRTKFSFYPSHCQTTILQIRLHLYYISYNKYVAEADLNSSFILSNQLIKIQGYQDLYSKYFYHFLVTYLFKKKNLSIFI